MQRFSDLVRKRNVEQVASADVDSDRDIQSSLPPGPALLQRCIQHEACERAHQTRVLGQSGRKASGVSSPCGRVLPAHERFGANDLSARQIGLRLEEDDELLP